MSFQANGLTLTANDAIIYLESELKIQISPIQKQVFTCAWSGYKYSEIASEIGYTEQYIKDVGAQLFKDISSKIDTNLSKRNFVHKIRAEISDRQVDFNFREHSWGTAPKASKIFGRDEEIDCLKQWIRDPVCKVISILGMKGIGKTKLSLKVAKGLECESSKRAEFKIIWRSLIHQPSIKEIIDDLVETISLQRCSSQLSSLEDSLSKLLKYLTEKKLLIILDNAESILSKWSAHSEYVDKQTDFGRLLSIFYNYEHQSCLLITSREKPADIYHIETEAGAVRSLNLQGLNYEFCEMIFDQIGSFKGSHQSWNKINSSYMGNPLALEFAARHINAIYGGDIDRFLTNDKNIFFEIKELLSWHISRLTDQEIEVLIWMALSCRPISLSEIQTSTLCAKLRNHLPEVIEALIRKIPVEISNDCFSLQPVIMEYIVEFFVRKIANELINIQFDYLLRFCLLKVTAYETIGLIHKRTILQPLYETLLLQFNGYRNLTEHLKKLIGTFREKKIFYGYAAGNIFNLYAYTGTIDQSLNFSGLYFREVDLQTGRFAGINFSNSQFLDSVFIYTQSALCGAAFSPCGKYLVTSDNNGKIIIFESKNFKKLTSFQANHARYWEPGLAFSPDSKLLISSGSDNLIRIWDFLEGTCLQVLTGHTSCIFRVTFSRDGQLIASASDDGLVKIWDVKSGQCLQTLTDHQDWVWFVDYCPNGLYLATASHDHTVRIWLTQTYQCIHVFEHSHWVCASVFSPDGQILASTSDKMIWIWEIETGRCLAKMIGHDHYVLKVKFQPNSSLIASCGLDGTVKIWDLKSFRCLHTLHGHIDWVYDLEFSPNGAFLVSCSYDKSVKVWDTVTWNCVKTIKGYTNWVSAVSMTSANGLAATGTEDGMVRVWDVKSRVCTQELNSPPNNHIYALKFSPNGQYLACGAHDQKLRIWRTINFECICNCLVNRIGGVYTIDFSPDSQTVVTGSQDGIVRLWDVESGRCLRKLVGHTNWLWAVRFNPNNQVLASGGDDKTVRFWSLDSGKCIQVISVAPHKVRSVSFSNDGMLLAIAGDHGLLEIWYTETAKCYQALVEQAGDVNAVIFSPCGNWLISGSSNGLIKVWDVQSGDCRTILQGHTNSVRSLDFCHDGRQFVSGSQDGTMRLWDFETLACLHLFQMERPYEGANFKNVQGLTSQQLKSLAELGAII